MSDDSLREIDKILDEVEFNVFTAPRNELQKRVAELEAEHARLRQQRDAANAQLDAANAQLDFVLENLKEEKAP